MASQTINKYIISALTVTLFFTFFSVILGQMDAIYDYSDVDDDFFTTYNFTDATEDVEETSGKMIDSGSGDESLFDVLGALALKVLEPFKAVLNGIQLLYNSLTNLIITLLGDELGNLLAKYILAVMGITLAIWFGMLLLKGNTEVNR